MSLIIAATDQDSVQLLADPLATNGWGSPQHLARKVKILEMAEDSVVAHLAIGITGNIAVLRAADKALVNVMRLEASNGDLPDRLADAAELVDMATHNIQEFWQLVIVGRQAVTGRFFAVLIQQNAGVVNYLDSRDVGNTAVENRGLRFGLPTHGAYIIAGAGEDYIRGWLDRNPLWLDRSGVLDMRSRAELAIEAMRQACLIIPALVLSPHIDKIVIDRRSATLSQIQPKEETADD